MRRAQGHGPEPGPIRPGKRRRTAVDGAVGTERGRALAPNIRRPQLGAVRRGERVELVGPVEVHHGPVSGHGGGHVHVGGKDPLRNRPPDRAVWEDGVGVALQREAPRPEEDGPVGTEDGRGRVRARGVEGHVPQERGVGRDGVRVCLADVDGPPLLHAPDRRAAVHVPAVRAHPLPRGLAGAGDGVEASVGRRVAVRRGVHDVVPGRSVRRDGDPVAKGELVGPEHLGDRGPRCPARACVLGVGEHHRPRAARGWGRGRHNLARACASARRVRGGPGRARLRAGPVRPAVEVPNLGEVPSLQHAHVGVEGTGVDGHRPVAAGRAADGGQRGVGRGGVESARTASAIAQVGEARDEIGLPATGAGDGEGLAARGGPAPEDDSPVRVRELDVVDHAARFPTDAQKAGAVEGRKALCAGRARGGRGGRGGPGHGGSRDEEDEKEEKEMGPDEELHDTRLLTAFLLCQLSEK